jgi:flagellar biosynthetic protein FlhB
VSADKSSKTEKPTPKRRKEGRQNGQIPKSTEFVAWVTILALSMTGNFLMTMIGRSFMEILARGALLIENPDPAEAWKFLGWALARGFLSITPLIGVALVAIFVTSIGQVGFVFSKKKLKPSFKNLNPLKGVKKLFGAQGIWESVKTLIKVMIIGFAAYRLLANFIPGLISNGRSDLSSIVAYTGQSTAKIVREVAVVSLILAIFDYGYNRWQTLKSLKMSKQEIIDEFKNMDGDPQVKGQRKQRMLQMSRLRMMAAVTQADAVIVNPTHIAVAIKYTPGRGAPKVIAKGIGALAERIRDKATEAHIPLVEDIPLARTLYKVCEIDDDVPQPLFEAVATVLAFVHSLKRTGRLAWGGIHKLGRPTVDLTYGDEIAKMLGKRRALPQVARNDA